MRRILVDSIKGSEKLARDIVNDNGTIIIANGTVLKKQYIERLKELDINYIYVEDELSEGVDDEQIQELLIQDQCLTSVKEIIDRYSYQEVDELIEIKKIAEEIIRDILKEPEIMFSIYGIRKKSESIYSHCINVCSLSVLIAIRMKLPRTKIRDIAVGSLLHDIGYNLVSFDYMDSIFNNCTKEQQKELMSHVIDGYSLLIRENWISVSSKDIILCHHERLDGSGYPFHKKADKIKIGSKIVGVCDEFDSKVYGHLEPKMKVHDTIRYLINQSGIKFDPDVINAFKDSIAYYPNGIGVITNEGETGIVLRQNPRKPARPVIRMITDIQGNKYNYWLEKDLTKYTKIAIWDTVEL